MMKTYDEEKEVKTGQLVQNTAYKLTKEIHSNVKKGDVIGNVSKYYAIDTLSIFKIARNSIVGDGPIPESGGMVGGYLETPNKQLMVRNLAQVVNVEFRTIKDIVDEMNKASGEIATGIANAREPKYKMPEIVIDGLNPFVESYYANHGYKLDALANMRFAPIEKTYASYGFENETFAHVLSDSVDATIGGGEAIIESYGVVKAMALVYNFLENKLKNKYYTMNEVAILLMLSDLSSDAGTKQIVAVVATTLFGKIDIMRNDDTLIMGSCSATKCIYVLDTVFESFLGTNNSKIIFGWFLSLQGPEATTATLEDVLTNRTRYEDAYANAVAMKDINSRTALETTIRDVCGNFATNFSDDYTKSMNARLVPNGHNVDSVRNSIFRLIRTCDMETLQSPNKLTEKIFVEVLFAGSSFAAFYKQSKLTTTDSIDTMLSTSLYQLICVMVIRQA